MKTTRYFSTSRWVSVLFAMILPGIHSAACGVAVTDHGEQSDAIPRLVDAPCRFPLASDQVEGESVTCSDLIVYESRMTESDRTIQLHIARYRGQSDGTPVVYLNGGPGGSVAALTGGIDQRAVSLLANGADLILFDQRGVGRSEPALDCPEVMGLPDLSDLAVWRDAYVAAVGACLDRHSADGADLAAYSSVGSAADVEDLRREFGFEQVDIVGVSYGTRLGLEVLRDYPEGVRAMVLDSVVAPQASTVVDGARNFQDAVSRLFGACSTDPACDEAYGGLQGTFLEAIDKLDAAPMVLPDLGVSLTGNHFIWSSFRAMYGQRNYPAAPAFVTAAAAGEAAEVERILRDSGATATAGGGLSLLMHHSMVCADGLRHVTQEEIDEAFDGVAPRIDEFFRVSLLEAYRAICDRIPVSIAPPSAREPVVSDVRVLIMSGEFDPVTPARYGHAVAETLSRATVVDFSNTGHVASMSSPCGGLLALGFLADPTAAIDARCAEAIDLTFDLPDLDGQRHDERRASWRLSAPFSGFLPH